jgi:hypothetical protein
MPIAPTAAVISLDQGLNLPGKNNHQRKLLRRKIRRMIRLKRQADPIYRAMLHFKLINSKSSERWQIQSVTVIVNGQPS